MQAVYRSEGTTKQSEEQSTSKRKALRRATPQQRMETAIMAQERGSDSLSDHCLSVPGLGIRLLG